MKTFSQKIIDFIKGGVHSIWTDKGNDFLAKGNYEAAILAFRNAAKEGDEEAGDQLFQMYLAEHGFVRNREKELQFLDDIFFLQNETDVQETAPLKSSEEEETDDDMESDDLLYLSVEEFVKQQDTISISKLQRHFGFGHDRAVKMIDQLYEEGVIGLPLKNGVRKVMKDEE